MIRYRNLLLSPAIAALLYFGAFAAPPNIVWIVADDMSPDMGCYGEVYAWTPNLDRLAAEGMRFTNAFAVNGQCAPSRSALITGMHPTSIGTHNMRSQALPPAHVRLFTHYLREAGYYCTNNGKADYNLGNGPDERSGIFRSPIGTWDAEGANAHWRGRSDGQPFFAVFNLSQTHESRLHFNDKAFENVVKDVPKMRRHDPARATLPAYYPDAPAFRSDWAKYHDMVSAMDVDAGRILAELDDDGLRGDTVVMFFGDHGRPLPRAKRWLYDSGLKVPLVVRWPDRIEAGTVNDALVSFVDFAPTVLRLAGLEVPEHLEGRVFLGDGPDAPRAYVFGQRDRVDELTDRVRSVRGPRYHYIRNDFPNIPYAYPLEYMDRMPSMQAWRTLHATGELSGPSTAFFAPKRPAEELYDTALDPDEVTNLAAKPEHAERLEAFRAALDAWIAETGDLGQIDEAVLNERWRPGGEWARAAAPAVEPAPGIVPKGTNITLSTEESGHFIVYTTDTGARPGWRLYSKPILVEDDVTLRVRSGRLGFEDSDELILEYSVK